MPDTIVEIPGVGPVSFPDSMSSDEMNAAAAKLYQQGQQKTAAPAPAAPVDTPASLLAGAWSQLNPVAAIASGGQAILHPLDTLRAIGAAHEATFNKGVDAYRKGNYLEAARHFGDYLIPVVGPAIDTSTDKMQQGQPFRGAGEVLGQELGLGLMARGAVVPSTPAVPKPPLAAIPAGKVAEALKFGEAQGVPIDAATATQNRAVQAAQYLADRSLGGSLVAKGAANRTAAALTKTGEALAGRVDPMAVTPEQAGAALQGALGKQVTAYATQAQGAYQTATAAAEQTGAAVDVAAAKKALAPLYDRLKRESELVPLQGGKARALVAMDRLMNGPDRVPLIVADRATSDLGALAGTPDLPELRTPGQGSAAVAFKALRQQVDSAAQQAGPDVFASLQQGRAATKAKYAVADLLKQLKGRSGEPVRSFGQVTAPKDSAIAQLRDLQQYAPAEIPKVGRAVLEDMLSTATQQGGFQHADRLYANWQRLGPETKRALFGDTTGDLDKFFLLAKKLAENPNPSNTSQVISMATQGAQAVFSPFTALVTQAGAAGMSALFHSPAFVKGLNRALSLELARASAPARAAAWAGVRSLVPGGSALGNVPALRMPVATTQSDQASTPQ